MAAEIDFGNLRAEDFPQSFVSVLLPRGEDNVSIRCFYFQSARFIGGGGQNFPIDQKYVRTIHFFFVGARRVVYSPRFHGREEVFWVKQIFE